MAKEIELLVMFAVMGLFCIASAVIGIYIESSLWNKGNCHKCGQPLEFFSFDSYGSRGYKCSHCWEFIWISYNSVDKYRNKMKKKDETKEKTNE